MPKEHKVRQGECISSIADKYGLFWGTIWNHSKNSELKEKRKDPNILYPGDVVFVPDKEEKEESCATEQQHRFRKEGVPVRLRIRMRRNTKPVVDAEYLLSVGDVVYKGRTDTEGWIEDHPIQPDSLKGKLLLTNKGLEFDLLLGRLDPIDTIEGVKERLANLGFDPGPVDGELSSQMEDALVRFQEIYGMEVTGKLAQETLDKLKEIHGS